MHELRAAEHPKRARDIVRMKLCLVWVVYEV